MTKYFVTGGAGFIGSHFCRTALQKGWATKLLNVDALTYAGNLENLKELESNPNYRFVHHDLTESGVSRVLEEFAPDVVIHFAAESHVDRSIEDPSAFLKTNILGTFELLDAIRKSSAAWAKRLRFVYVSTDEVYGALGPTGQFYETTPLQPRSPYSASKAAADMLSSAYFHTYKMDTLVVRCSNNYGPYQFPEKLIPQTVIFALQKKRIPVYGKGENVRDWIFVSDFVNGIKATIDNGKSGEAYNFGGDSERKNIDVVRKILQLCDRSEDLIQYVEDRKGHDFRYAMNFEKSTRDLQWSPEMDFERGIETTVNWYISNEEWWRHVMTGEYQRFFQSYYGARSAI